MKYLKLFDKHVDYQDSSSELPLLAYCKDQEDVHINTDYGDCLIAYFNIENSGLYGAGDSITDTSNVKLYYKWKKVSSDFLNYIKIDGSILDLDLLDVSEYYPMTYGEHKVVYSIKDNIDSSFYYSAFVGINFYSIDVPALLLTNTNSVFAATTALEYVKLPEGIEEIPISTFTGSGIKNIKLPDSVQIIGVNAFGGSQLQNIEFNKNLKHIYTNAFGATKLEKLILPDSVIDVSSNGFGVISTLKYVKISDNLKTLNSAVFQGCTELEDVDFGNGIETIMAGAFNGVTKLKSIILPDSVIDVQSGAFSSVTACKDIRLSNNLKIIKSGAFNTCGSKTLRIPNDVTIQGGNFNSSLIENIIFDGSVYIQGGSFTGNVKIKSLKINPYSTLDGGAFYNCLQLEDIYIDHHVNFSNGFASAFPQGNCLIKKIYLDSDITGFYSSNYYNLETLFFGDNLNIIRNNWLSGGVKNVIFGKNIKNLNEYICKGNTNIKTIIFNSSIENITGRYAFSESSLEYINLQDTSIESLPENAFTRSAIRYIELPDTLKVLPDDGVNHSAFSYCSQLEYVKLSNNCSIIPESTFHGCRSLKDIIIPPCVKTIESWVFSYTGLTHLEIPSTVERITGPLWDSNNIPPLTDVSIGILNCSTRIFNGNPRLNTLTLNGDIIYNHNDLYWIYTNILIIGNNVKTIAKQALYRTKANNVIFAENSQLTTIKESAFDQNTLINLNYLILPDSLQVIEKQAFYRTKMNIVELGSNITYIGSQSFETEASGKITSFTINTVTPPTLENSNAFTYWNLGSTTPGTYPIYVPDSAVESYKTAENWIDVSTRIFGISEK